MDNCDILASGSSCSFAIGGRVYLESAAQAEDALVRLGRRQALHGQLADLVLLAMGFLGPVQDGMIKTLGVELDQRGNVKANVVDYRTSRAKVFSAGDMRRGQSLVVWAIREGRQAAHAIDRFLMGETDLPR